MEKPPLPKKKQVSKYLADHMMHETKDPVMIQLLSPEAKIDLKIEKGLSELENHYIALMLTDANNYQGTVEGLLRKFSNQHATGLYITINKPAKILLKNWKKRNIPADNIKIIDGSSHLTGVSTDDLTNVKYLDSPADLSELILAIEHELREKGKNSFLILDSITTLLVYNEPSAVEKFVHSLMGKIEESEVQGVLLMLESEKFKDIIQTLSQFCDRIVEMA